MKLLLDENISRRIVPELQAKFPGSSHVAMLGMEQFDDRPHDFVIVRRDDDFRDLLQVRGLPPQNRIAGNGKLLKSAGAGNIKFDPEY